MRALAFIVPAALAVNVALLGALVYSGGSGDNLFTWGSAAYGLLWLASLAEVLYYQHAFDPRRSEPTNLIHLRKGIALYLAGDNAAAEEEFKAIIRRSPDDLEAHLYLAGVYREMKDIKKAERYYKKVLLLDEPGKWKWQVEREIRALK
ncbi:MAG: tetratricopeptide repeat protein [Planctomycetota bacterium]|nr:tetratricopeptide repeat protein [Planctomycetota bacterium]